MNIITRAQWGARHARGFRAAPLPASRLYLHHSVTAPGNGTPAGDVAAVRALETIGQQRFGGGISYTFAVTTSGRVYEGHGIDRQGAHTANLNSTARAICLVGNYDVNRPPEAMINAVAELVAHGHRMKWWPDRLTGGHRDAPGAATACPGRFAQALIPVINSRVAEILSGKAPTRKKAKPMFIERPLVHGKNYHRIACPVGSASSLFGRGWVSVTMRGGGNVTLRFQRNAPVDEAPPGAGPSNWNNSRFRNASRIAHPMPSGTEFIEIWADVFGKDDGYPNGSMGSILIEMEPK